MIYADKPAPAGDSIIGVVKLVRKNGAIRLLRLISALVSP